MKTIIYQNIDRRNWANFENLHKSLPIIGLQNIWRGNQLASQLFCNPDKFESAWMLARIASPATHRKVANASLLWWKTINPIFDTIFSPTIFNLETFACVRLVLHDRYPSALRTIQNLSLHLLLVLLFSEAPNGLRYLRVGGRGLCLGAGKTRSQKKACKPRRLPHVRCTLC